MLLVLIDVVVFVLRVVAFLRRNPDFLRSNVDEQRCNGLLLFIVLSIKPLCGVVVVLLGVVKKELTNFLVCL